MEDFTWRCDSLKINKADGSTIDARGSVILDAVGNLEIKAEIPDLILDCDHFVPDLTINGIADDRLSLNSTGCFLTQILPNLSIKTTQLTFKPRECILSTANDSIRENKRVVYLKSLKCIGSISFDHDAIYYNIRPLDINQDCRQGLIRGILEIRNLNQDNFNGDLLEMELLTLLSLAQRCLIFAPRKDFYYDDRLIKIVLHPIALPYEVISPLISCDRDSLQSFLQNALPALKANMESYALFKLIFYYCRSHMEEYCELKFALASIFMEGIKFYWAKNIARIQQDLKSNGIIRGFIKPNKGKGGKTLYFSFEELLNKLATSLGYSTSFSFIEDRNRIFHTGSPSGSQLGATSTWALLKPELEKLYDQMDDLILRILGYSGPIHPYFHQDSTLSFPSRTPI